MPALSNSKATPVVIISRDRLSPLMQLLAWLARAGYTNPIIVDSASTYPPLTDFLDRSANDIGVVRLERNVGHLAPWFSRDLHAKLDIKEPVVVTDCDVLPDESCPHDVVDHLASVLSHFGDIDKVGLGLRIDDLPDRYALRNEVLAWERQFWEKEVAPGVYDAPVDAPFALYRNLTKRHSPNRALRTGAPYWAQHIPWYADSADPTEEEFLYREHADRRLTHWEASNDAAGLRRLVQR